MEFSIQRLIFFKHRYLSDNGVLLMERRSAIIDVYDLFLDKLYQRQFVTINEFRKDLCEVQIYIKDRMILVFNYLNW